MTNSMIRFFAGLHPDDFREMAQRLRARWPYYASVARLDGDASPHR